MCVRAIVNENGGVPRHGTTHRVPLQHLLNDRLDYSCMAAIFSQHEILCAISPSPSNYITKNKKNQNKGIIKKRSAKRRSGNGGRQRKQLNSEMPRDLKTPYTLEPILPAVCEKKCFLLLSFLSQRKTTLIP